MDSLRWILLGLGVAVIAGIYIFAQISKQRRREPAPSYEQVDWEQDSVEGLSESDEEFYDDLPSMDALNSARATHRAEGNSLPSASLEDTQEIPVLQDVAEVADEADIEEVVEEPSTLFNANLRNNLLLEALPEEPVMGTPISHVELEAEEPSPSVNADSLSGVRSTRSEPSFTDSLGLDSMQMAAALQRRRLQEPEVEKARVKSPVQNAFSFPEGSESAQLGNEDRKLEKAANQRLQESAAERVRAKAEVLKQQAAERAQANYTKPVEAVAKPLDPVKEEQEKLQAVQEEVVVLHVKATGSIGFYGPEMAQCFDDIGIKFGDMDIYHYQSGGQRLLSVANMVKPGTFDPNNFTGFTTPGITLFLQLRPNSDFELCEQVLVKSAQYIAYKLKGEVLNAQHQALDNVKQAALSRDIASIKSAFDA